MGENSVRLNKVIREFNISLERVVEFLLSKGHEIDARPTSKISNEQYSLLSHEFSSDRSSKVESHDLSEEKKKEKEELRIKFEKITNALSICPEKIFFVLGKIRFVLDKIILFMTKCFLSMTKILPTA